MRPRERADRSGETAARIGGAEVLDVLEAVRRTGIDVANATVRAGIDVAALRQGGSVAAPLLVRLMMQLERDTGDSLVGLHVAERAEPRGPLAHLLASCANLEDALMRSCRFGPVLVTTMCIRLAREREHFVFEYELGDPGLEACRHVADYVLMSTARTIRRSVGEDAYFVQVHLRHSDDGDRAEIERAFGCRARFGETRDRLLIPRSVAARTPRMSNPLVADQIEKFAAALLPEAVLPASFAAQVANVTRTLLGAGVRAERKLVARRMGVSERTLHRRLTDERANFRDLRESVLWEIAEALVSDSDLKLEAIAESVGFSDAAAFSKAFKRRTGRSPLHYRRSTAATGRG